MADDVEIVGDTVPAMEVELRAPVSRPGKIVCLGLNYADHAEEGGYDVPEEPLLFAKATSAVIGPHDPIVYPRSVKQLDFEAELALVIGETARHVERESAERYLAGYTVFNDVSARDVQYGYSQFFRGKSFDTFAPLGPGLVTPDAVDVSKKNIRTLVNGTVKQSSSTAEMIFDVPRIIESVSHTMTLYPGDIIATGTPPGVGVHREPPELLEPGDEVVVEIEDVGTIRNTVQMAE
ncbi:fumarylacetoacetate hydrolase family protein [Natrialbaceae archaeon A-CW1-1]